MKEQEKLKLVKKLQADELFEYHVYVKIASFVKDEKDKATLLKISQEEMTHYNIWKNYTKCDVKPNMFLVYWYVFLARILGYTFIIKKMEEDLLAVEKDKTYLDFSKEDNSDMQDIKIIIRDEARHEKALIEMIDEEKLQYVGSMVLGLNDALVEFTGSLAGWTFAMQSNRLISLAGLIIGIAATLSMASSEYLSVKNEGGKNAIKSSTYTGGAYLFTVIALLLPYLLLPDKSYLIALVIMLVVVIVIIAAFNYYIAVAKSISFKKKFLEMSAISLSVAVASFIIGLLVKQFLGIDV